MPEDLVAIATEPKALRWSIDEYHRLADAGLFDDRRVELIDGEILELSPQKSRHAVAIGLVEAALRRTLGEGFWVRTQMPLTLGGRSEPEPDVAVVRGHLRDYTDQHPTTALLVVEVSDSSLAYDRRRKAGLYASHCVAEYWVLNLADRRLEVFRRPVVDPEAPFGTRYAESLYCVEGDSVQPLHAPLAPMAIADLLP